jgi:hypothetical protein
VILVDSNVGGIAKMSKKGQRNNGVMVLVLVVIGLFFFGPQLGIDLGGLFGGTTDTGDGNGGTGSGIAGLTCAQTLGGNTQSLSVEGVDFINTGTETTGERWLLFENGIKVGNKTSSTNVDPGAEVDILVFDALSGGYSHITNTYRSRISQTLECKPTVTLQPSLGKWGGLNLTILNNDGVSKNEGNVEAIGSGQGVTFTIKPKAGTSDGWWGNPELDYYVMTLNASNSEFDTSMFTLDCSSGCSTVTKISVPQKDVGSGGSVLAWRVSPALSDFDEHQLRLFVKAKEGTDPTTNMTLVFEDPDYYIHSVTGEILEGVETDLQNDVGQTDITRDKGNGGLNGGVGDDFVISIS